MASSSARGRCPMSCGPDGRGVGVEGVDVDSFLSNGGLSHPDMGLTSMERVDSGCYL